MSNESVNNNLNGVISIYLFISGLALPANSLFGSTKYGYSLIIGKEVTRLCITNKQIDKLVKKRKVIELIRYNINPG